MAKSEFRVEAASKAHGWSLAPRLRKADADEMFASHGMKPSEGVRFALEVSSDAKAMMSGPKVAALFGTHVLSWTDETGTYPDAKCLWVLTADVVDKKPIAFMRTCKTQLALLLKRHEVLWNFIDARHEKALRWAKWLGFEIFPAQPWGEGGLLFHPVRLRRSPCASPQ